MAAGACIGPARQMGILMHPSLPLIPFGSKGTAPNGFHIGLKDTSKKEVKVEAREVIAVSASDWQKVVVPLSRFADTSGQVNSATVENISFGFGSSHGAGNLCIDDIAFQ